MKKGRRYKSTPRKEAYEQDRKKEIDLFLMVWIPGKKTAEISLNEKRLNEVRVPECHGKIPWQGNDEKDKDPQTGGAVEEDSPSPGD